MAKSKCKRKKRSSVKTRDRNRSELRAKLKTFILKLGQISDASGAGDAFNKIPIEDLGKIFFTKIRYFPVLEKEKGKIRKRTMDFFKEQIKKTFKEEKFGIVKGCPHISLYDYYYAGARLKHYLKNLRNEDYPEAVYVKESFKDFMTVVDEKDVPTQFTKMLASLYSRLFGSFDGGFLKFHIGTVNNPDGTSYNCFEIEVVFSEFEYFELRGKSRPGYKVGFLTDHENFEWIKLKAAKFGVKGAIGNLDLDVYIQSHAINRLKERLHPYLASETQNFLFRSLRKNLKIIKYKGKFLIEYRILKYKVGYLVAEVHGNRVIILTFLLLTQKGTPEWDKLKEQVGFSEEGIKYFGLGKLSSFAFSDIKDNEKLKTMFSKAGCKDLFDAGKYCMIKIDERKCAEAVSKYLQRM